MMASGYWGVLLLLVGLISVLSSVAILLLQELGIVGIQYYDIPRVFFPSGLLSIVTGFIAWGMGHACLIGVKRGSLDNRWRELIVIARACGVLGTAIGFFVLLLACLVAK